MLPTVVRAKGLARICANGQRQFMPSVPTTTGLSGFRIGSLRLSSVLATEPNGLPLTNVAAQNTPKATRVQITKPQPKPWNDFKRPAKTDNQSTFAVDDKSVSQMKFGNNRDKPKDKTLQELERTICSAKTESQYLNAAEALVSAWKQKIPGLSAQTLMYGIKACVEAKRVDDHFSAAIWALDKLRETKVAGVETYEHAMNLCGKYSHVDRAVALMEQYRAHGYKESPSFLSSYITLLARSDKDRPVAELEELYTALKGIQIKNYVVGMRVYLAVAERFCYAGQSDKVLGVLRDMTESGHEPTQRDCDSLLQAALHNADTAVLRVLLSWYRSNFNAGLLDGQSSHVLHIAGNVGDAQLGLAAFQMLRDSGLDVTPIHYYNLVRALLLGGDLVSAMEAIVEMERVGASFLYQPAAVEGPATQLEFDHDCYVTMKSLLVDCITTVNRKIAAGADPEVRVPTGREQLDMVYFALVEQVREGQGAEGEQQGPRVPRILVDALIHSAGKVGQLERAFKIFQECRSLFGVEPDLTTANALLAACGARTAVPMTTAFAVFQDIESTYFTQPSLRGSKAANHSFTILLEAMLLRKEFGLLGRVVDHMLSTGALAHPRTLRNVVVGCAMQEDEDRWEQVEKLKGVMVGQRLGMSAAEMTPEVLSDLAENPPIRLPANTVRKLEQIKQGQPATSKPSRESKEEPMRRKYH